MGRSQRRDAFTLFEVMAAVLVLGMLYAVLANSAMQGLQSEGETRRRLEASLIADRALADLELQLTLGEAPPTGSAEELQDPYLVRVTVQPFDATVLRPPPEPGESEPAPSPDSLLAPPSAGNEGRLRRIDVRVSWLEADEERSIGRTTFAFDTTGLEEAFGEEGEQAQTPDEAPSEDAIQQMEKALRDLQ